MVKHLGKNLSNMSVDGKGAAMRDLVKRWNLSIPQYRIGAHFSAVLICAILGAMHSSRAYAQDQEQGTSTINKPRAAGETLEARSRMLARALKMPPASPESRRLAHQVIDILGLPPAARLYRNISDSLDHDKFAADIHSNPRFAERLKIDHHYGDRLTLRRDLSVAATRAVQRDVEEKVLPILEDYYAANLTNQDMENC
jgi:hypothetical protein